MTSLGGKAEGDEEEQAGNSSSGYVDRKKKEGKKGRYVDALSITEEVVKATEPVGGGGEIFGI